MSKIEKLVDRIVEREPSRVLIQIPEGLRTRIQEIEEELEDEGIETVVSLDPCYGACDLKDGEALEMDCDLLVHVGHNRFMDSGIETLYFPWYYDLDPVPVLEKNKETWKKYDRIGLITSINFTKAMKRAKEYLENEGKEVSVEDGKRTREGQVLGCDVTAALSVEKNVDCYLYLGSGAFHPLGLALKTEKPVLVLNFEKESIEEADCDKFVRQRHAAIEKARDAEKFGILVSTKKGQMKVELAERIKKKLEEENKRVYIFSMDEIRPEKLMGVKVDAWVNTACPRIAIEHRADFSAPILNPGEVEEVLQKL
ncbi:MAG: diphthamide biosynthesis enzyme Dph2 [Candidatus Aenigmatarchaeota archaeon]